MTRVFGLTIGLAAVTAAAIAVVLTAHRLNLREDEMATRTNLATRGEQLAPLMLLLVVGILMAM